MTETSKVGVAVRIRPLLEKFGEAFQVKCAKKATEDTICMTHPTDDSPNSGKSYNFTYNYVFDDEDSQADIYESMKGLVDSSLDGHNATIFTYGQTGSGKTHTVLGQVDHAAGQVRIGSNTGLFMRVLDDLMRYRAANASRTHVVITIAILEIHREVLKDLLAKSKVLDLQRNRFGDDAAPGLKLMEVKDLTDCFNVFQIGQANRSVAATKMNDVSSRSHAVFMIDILQQEKTAANPDPPNPLDIYNSQFGSGPTKAEDIPIRKSRLCLVDLAGSERLKRSEAEGETLKETQAINTSLSCLGNVVNALYEGKSFVGYRDSKLTMLLKSSFERANSKVLLITNISPIASSFSESMGSLRFADRVMGLKAKQVFVLDADSEQDYLDSLRLHAELCADVRLAIASHDLHLHGGKKLKRLRGPDGNFSKDIIAKLHAEHKKQCEEQTALKLDQLVNKLLSQRELQEQREKRITEVQALQLKCEEQELLVQALKSEEQQFDAATSLTKEEYKYLKKMTKSAEKAIAAIKEECKKTDDDLAAIEEECVALLKQIEEEENKFVDYREMPLPAPPPPEDQPLAIPLLDAVAVPGSATPPPELPSDQSGFLAKSSVLSMDPESSGKASRSRRDSSSEDESPGRGARPKAVSFALPEVKKAASREEIAAATRAAAEASAQLRRQREELWRKGEASSATVRRMAETAEKMGDDDEEDEEEDEEDEE
eukprot:EG_transcript_4853